MAAKRKPKPPRIIPPKHPTGAAELAATAGDKYRAVIDGVQWGIRERDTGQFDARPGMTEGQVRDEVARLNKGLHVSPESQGIGKRPREAAGGAWWAQFLEDVDETRAVLERWKAEGRKLSPADVKYLMTYRDEHVDLRQYEWLRPRLPTLVPPPPSPVRNIRVENLRAKRQIAAEHSDAEARRIKKAEDDERKLIEAVGKQLCRVWGLGRTNWRATRKGQH
jgi:hypothetical protein